MLAGIILEAVFNPARLERQYQQSILTLIKLDNSTNESLLRRTSSAPSLFYILNLFTEEIILKSDPINATYSGIFYINM